MIREWTTVESWQNGVATLRAEIKSACSSCPERKGCGSHLLNQGGIRNAYVMQISCPQPLQPGQRVELGITGKSLLESAVLVYITPLLGLFVVAGLFQLLFHTDLAAACGALVGGAGGFIIARGLSALLDRRTDFQPIILSVALPTDVLRVETAED